MTEETVTTGKYVTRTVIILAIVLIMYLVYCDYKGKSLTEGFRSCSSCDNDLGNLPRDGLLVLNPFIAPYSVNKCVDDLYIQATDAEKTNLYLGGPLTNLSTPDHVVLTN